MSRILFTCCHKTHKLNIEKGQPQM